MRTNNIPFFLCKKDNYPKLSQICSCGSFSQGTQEFLEFKTAVVNEPSVVEALNVYCNKNFEQIGDGLNKASFKQLLCFFSRAEHNLGLSV